MRVKLPSLAEIEAERLRRESRQRQCIWPDEYAQESAECAWRFVTECWWTYDDEREQISLIPPKPYLRQYVSDWLACFQARKAAIFEKSRRTVVSNTTRGLETWLMGLKRRTWLIVDQTHENASGQLWRVHFGLQQLAIRRPELKLPPYRAFGALDRYEATAVALANGSLFTESHQDAGAVQGRGKTGVTLEELSRYRDAAAYWGQAKIISSGGAGSAGGWLCGIANPSMNTSWRELKCGVNPRELLGWE